MKIKSISIVGGGFYGTTIALYLKKIKKVPHVVIFEKEDSLISRASFYNQARVHNGYHYPRSFTTANRSHINFDKFCNDWDFCIKKNFDNYYAISRINSKVNSNQFNNFCDQIGIPLNKAEDAVNKLFNPKLVASTYKVEEYLFDANKLRKRMKEELRNAGVDVKLSSDVVDIKNTECSDIEIIARSNDTELTRYITSMVFNCTYSGINHVSNSAKKSIDKLKHEIAEIALIEVPDELNSFGITIIDGSFFSVVPYPAKGCHSISHVRYTPHYYWHDQKGINPYELLSNFNPSTRVDRMLRDAARYLPALSECKYRESFFEIKTVHMNNEIDDGRPIIIKKDKKINGIYSILGSKLDNIYEILDTINNILIQDYE